METAEVALTLAGLGCPKEKCLEMASQLEKRAQQISAKQGQSYEASLQYLLNLMQQGWAAQKKE